MRAHWDVKRSIRNPSYRYDTNTQSARFVLLSNIRKDVKRNDAMIKLLLSKSKEIITFIMHLSKVIISNSYNNYIVSLSNIRKDIKRNIRKDITRNNALIKLLLSKSRNNSLL